MNDLKKVKVTCCEGEGQGSCKRCVDKGMKTAETVGIA